MILVNDLLEQHALVVKASGGADGVRDLGVLQSAVAKPFKTFDGVDLYPAVLEKAAVLLESIVVNYPFVDGNKRAGYTVTRSFLKINGIDIVATLDQRYEFVIAVASGEMHYEEILAWLTANTQKI